ncbi:30S ribosomal protein S18 [Mycoplasma crocodyli]|uniref:Small ribosomal subunit protein bS18 n=1 Tax=Mycoplasma crocodyli (strain ATCC 51981 / MP145) TaxID=512564 RepID=D5E5N2_MYCCM|nr:30S ribosomal protein S18 [Mycoplasma crocodyli]ADE19972.1 30S ribosomal protein S18 [Mycoplasma crocodyli MP145]
MKFIKKKKNFQFKKRACEFCENHVQYIDYKDVETLKKYINATGQIKPKANSGACAKHQRKIASAIKRARYIAFLPYTVSRVRLSK